MSWKQHCSWFGMAPHIRKYTNTCSCKIKANCLHMKQLYWGQTCLILAHFVLSTNGCGVHAPAPQRPISVDHAYRRNISLSVSLAGWHKGGNCKRCAGTKFPTSFFITKIVYIIFPICLEHLSTLLKINILILKPFY